MNEIVGLYDLLHNHLKGVALESLLEKERLMPHEKEAIRLISRLPSPSTATFKEMEFVCDECLSRRLEFAYQIGDIGNLAGVLRKKIKISRESLPDTFFPVPYLHEPREYDTHTLGTMLTWNNSMMHRVSYYMSHLLMQSDITLKSRCPYCQGDLVEVIVDEKELRLRCQQQSRENCKKVDWFIQTVEKR